MIRVLADANVFVSAVLARSPDAPSVQILDAALAGQIELIVSPVLLAEIESVLTRPRLRRYLSADQTRRFLIDSRALWRSSATQFRPRGSLPRSKR